MDKKKQPPTVLILEGAPRKDAGYQGTYYGTTVATVAMLDENGQIELWPKYKAWGDGSPATATYHHIHWEATYSSSHEYRPSTIEEVFTSIEWNPDAIKLSDIEEAEASIKTLKRIQKEMERLANAYPERTRTAGLSAARFAAAVRAKHFIVRDDEAQGGHPFGKPNPPLQPIAGVEEVVNQLTAQGIKTVEIRGGTYQGPVRLRTRCPIDYDYSTTTVLGEANGTRLVECPNAQAANHQLGRYRSGGWAEIAFD